MKDLCIDARMICSSGIGTYLKNLIWYVKSSSFQCRLLIDPRYLAEERWLSEFEIIPIRSKIYSIQEQLQLPILIPKCDLFWSPHYNIPILPIRAKKRLITIHDVYHLAYFSTLKWKEKIYAKSMIEFAVKLSDQIITDSYFSKKEILKYTQAESANISVIPLGVDTKRFSKEQVVDKIAFVRKTYRLPNQFVLFVGNIKPHKNLKGLLKAFESVLTEELHLVIVGQKDTLLNSENIRQMIEANSFLRSRIIFLGYIPEEHLPALYASAAVGVFPSLYEGFGLPPLEAMSMGCPVVVSDVASLPEVCGAGAEYVNPHDPEDIARGILKVFREDGFKKRLIVRGFKRAAQFSWEKTAEQHIVLMEKMVRG